MVADVATDVAADVAPQRPRRRNFLARSLLLLSFILNLGVIVSLFLIFLAGTMGTSEDNPFILRSLSIATFSTPTQPAIHLTWFLNSLGYTAPEAPPPSHHRTGLLYNINTLTPGGQFELPRHLERAARDAGLRAIMGGCFGRPYGMDMCTDLFFHAWGRAGGPHVFSTAPALYAFYAATVLHAVALGRRSVAVAALAALAGVVGAVAVSGLAVGAAWWVGRVEAEDGRVMEGGLNAGFFGLVWGVVGMGVGSALAVLGSRWAEKGRRAWWEEVGVELVGVRAFLTAPLWERWEDEDGEEEGGVKGDGERCGMPGSWDQEPKENEDDNEDGDDALDLDVEDVGSEDLITCS